MVSFINLGNRKYRASANTQKLSSCALKRVRKYMNDYVVKLFPDQYTRDARWCPSVLVSLPIAALLASISAFYINTPGFEVIKNIAVIVLSLSFAGGAAIKFLSGKIRDEGKKLEEREFRKRNSLPTTEFLLWSNAEFSVDYKTAIRNAIKVDFNRELLGENVEKSDETRARKLIAEAVDLIRPRVKDGVRLLQYNIRYGRARNLAAGSRVVGLPSAIVCLFLSLLWLDCRACVVVESLLLIFYFWQTIMSSANMRWYGEEYARVLFAEYMESRSREKSHRQRSARECK